MSIAAYFAGKSAKKLLGKFGVPVAIVVMVVVILGLTYCTGSKNGGRKEVVKQQERTIKIEQQVGEANEGAANQRLSDQDILNKQEKELSNALTEQNPNDRAIRAGCNIMQQQGRDTSEIPACSRYNTSE